MWFSKLERPNLTHDSGTLSPSLTWSIKYSSRNVMRSITTIRKRLKIYFHNNVIFFLERTESNICKRDIVYVWETFSTWTVWFVFETNLAQCVDLSSFESTKDHHLICSTFIYPSSNFALESWLFLCVSRKIYIQNFLFGVNKKNERDIRRLKTIFGIKKLKNVFGFSSAQKFPSVFTFCVMKSPYKGIKIGLPCLPVDGNSGKVTVENLQFSSRGRVGFSLRHVFHTHKHPTSRLHT